MKNFWKYIRQAFTWMFAELDSSFSVRKFWGITGALIFAFACVYYKVQNNGSELPIAYELILESIVVFYFAKETLRKIKIGTKKEDN